MLHARPKEPLFNLQRFPDPSDPNKEPKSTKQLDSSGPKGHEEVLVVSRWQERASPPRYNHIPAYDCRAPQEDG